MTTSQEDKSPPTISPTEKKGSAQVATTYQHGQSESDHILIFLMGLATNQS